jgi:hypothetical protein
VRMKPHYLRRDRLHPGWTTLLRIAKTGSAFMMPKPSSQIENPNEP